MVFNSLIIVDNDDDRCEGMKKGLNKDGRQLRSWQNSEVSNNVNKRQIIEM